MSFEPRTIAVPVGLGPEDQLALDRRAVGAAVEMARTWGAKLILLHVRVDPAVVVSFPQVQASYAELLAETERWDQQNLAELKGLADARSLVAETRAVDATGSVARTIVEQVAPLGIDLLVLSSHSRHGAGHLLLGSVAEKVVHLSPVPVLMLPNPENAG